MIFNDYAGNMVNYDGATRSYNAANQMTNDGTNTLTYDNNGNLTSDGVNAYTWDRANRMLTAPGSISYKYDGLGNRIQQTVSSVVSDYLNDVQPGLTKLLKQDDGSNVDHFIHAPRGIHAVDDGTDWNYYMQDGLGSVRGLVDDAAQVQSSMSYDPYGNPQGSYGAGFGFTGEQTDANSQVYLRARYYNPAMGVFNALDPFEGMPNRPMSLNGYSWVEGNVPNMVDPSGKCPPFSSLQYGSIRRRNCERVQRILERGGIPTFQALADCYYCAPMEYTVGDCDLTDEQLRPSYLAGLEAAATDGFISGDQVREIYDAYFAIPRRNCGPSYVYRSDDDWGFQAAGTITRLLFNLGQLIDGYIEGASVALTVVQGGIEVVYNFNTFQRMIFTYGGVGVNIGIPDWKDAQLASANTYVGHIQGFRSTCLQHETPNHIDNFEQFRRQYEGEFNGSSIGLAVGWSHFSSPSNLDDPSDAVYGNAITLGAGYSTRNADGNNGSGGYSRTYYQAVTSTRKSYLQRDCRVNTSEMVRDIMIGQDSPLALAGATLLLPAVEPLRIFAAASAVNAAENHNKRIIADPCACKCNN